MGVRVAQSLVFCDVFCRSIIVLFRLIIALSVLRIMASDYPFDIFKLFLSTRQGIITIWKSCFLLESTSCFALEFCSFIFVVLWYLYCYPFTSRVVHL